MRRGLRAGQRWCGRLRNFRRNSPRATRKGVLLLRVLPLSPTAAVVGVFRVLVQAMPRSSTPSGEVGRAYEVHVRASSLATRTRHRLLSAGDRMRWDSTPPSVVPLPYVGLENLSSWPCRRLRPYALYGFTFLPSRRDVLAVRAVRTSRYALCVDLSKPAGRLLPAHV